jgi:cytosine/adenosine deaminase-related metal-dependent hydrolase
VLTLDAALGDFETADVLIEGNRIAQVARRIDAAADTIDASRMLVMPGFVDTHRHMWQGALRNILPNGLLSDYGRDITGAARAVFRPEDARIGDLVTALGALNAGVTTVLDWSHIGNSPAHTDAAIAGLRESGIRAVYAFGPGSGAGVRHPEDIRRLRKEHFASADSLLTLALAGGLDPRGWSVARDVGARISVHVNGGLGVPVSAMGPDVTYIHCTGLDEDAWRRIAATGGHVSIACPIEMEMGHGVPPVLESLAHGIRPSLSVDVETQMPGEMFTQMRAMFTLQRMLALARAREGGGAAPRLLTAREVIEFATVAGARANGLESRIGTLTPGKEADIVLLRRDAINVLPFNNAYGAVVQAMDTSNVDTVLVAGRIVKRDGQLTGVDIPRVRQAAEAARDGILSRAGWSRSVLGRDRQGH